MKRLATKAMLDKWQLNASERAIIQRLTKIPSDLKSLNRVFDRGFPHGPLYRHEVSWSRVFRILQVNYPWAKDPGACRSISIRPLTDQ
jgi:hypothetical protein